MKILYVGQPQADGFSAPSVHIREVMEGLTRRGHQVAYLPGCSVHGNLVRQIFQRWQFARQLRKRLKLERPDWVYQREQLADPFVAEICHQLDIAYALEINGLLSKELLRLGARPWTRWVTHLLQGRALRRSRLVVTAAANWTQLLMKEHSLDGQRFRFIQNGVRLDEFQPHPRNLARERVGIAQDALVLGFVGSIYRNQDFEPALKAVQKVQHRYPDLRVVLVGPGPSTPKVRRLVANLGLDALVEFRGGVSHAEIPYFISSFDVCLMPYCSEVLDENNGIFSMKLQEYTACGRPLLAHDRPGSDSYASVREFGWPFDPNDEKAAVVALEACLSQAEQRQSKGVAARHYAEDLSWDKVAERIEKALLERGARPH